MALPAQNPYPPLQDVKSWGTTPIPYSQEAEESVLGAIILNPAAFVTVSVILEAEDFYILRHKYIYEAMRDLLAEDKPVDYMTVMQKLKDRQQLEEIGGAQYLTHLLNNTPTSLHAEVYAQMVAGRAERRRLMVASDHIKGLCLNDEMNIEELRQEANAKVIAATRTAYQSQIATVSEALSTYFATVESRQEGIGTKNVGMPTGIRVVDNAIYGMMRGQVNYLAATTGAGKTTFALNVAINEARLGARVAYFTLEMTRERLVNYMMGVETGIDPTRIELGKMTQPEWGRFVKASGNMYEIGKNIHIWETPMNPDFRMTPTYLLTQINALAYHHGVDLVIVDYVGLMVSGNERHSEFESRSYVARAMPIMARRLNLPLLLLAQIPIKKLQSRKDKHPTLGDIEYVGENDMDVGMYLHRDYIFDQTADPTAGELIIGKARGRSFRGSIPIRYENNKFLG